MPFSSANPRTRCSPLVGVMDVELWAGRGQRGMRPRERLLHSVQSVGWAPSEVLFELPAIASCVRLECRQETIKYDLESC